MVAAGPSIPPTFRSSPQIQHIAAGEGRLLALGDAEGETDRAGKAWVSPDGRSWTEVGPGLPIGADYLTAVAYDERSHVFVVGGHGPAGLQVWFTADGAEWSPAQPLAIGEGTLSGISARNGIVVATGTVGGLGIGPSAFAWRVSIGDAVAPHETILVERAAAAYDFHVAAGNGVALVEGSVVETDGEEPVGRAWYGVLAVP